MEISNDTLSTFFILYNNVFNNNDTVKLCGRENCAKLIDIATKIDPFTCYGRVEFGILDVSNIIKLKNKLLLLGEIKWVKQP